MAISPAASTDIRERWNQAAVAATNQPAAVAATRQQFAGGPPSQERMVDPQVPDGIKSHKPQDKAPVNGPFVITEKKYVGEAWTECPDEIRTVPFAVSTGNWGNLSNGSDKFNYQVADLDTTPGHVWGVQELNWDACQDLINAKRSEILPNVRNAPARHEQHQWLIMRGFESGTTVAVAARNVMFKALRMDMFHLHEAGIAKGTLNSKKYNRILCCTLKCRYAYFEDGETRDEIGVVVAHMNNLCAKKETKEGATHHNDFWNTLAGAIHKYNGRFFEHRCQHGPLVSGS